MDDNWDVYRVIQMAKDRVISRASGYSVIDSYDSTVKVEYNDGDESYADGFWDYHGGDR